METVTKSTILGAAHRSLTSSEKQLGWSVGENSARNEGNLNWDEILDQVDFENQKLIVHHRRRDSFDDRWLELLFTAKRRKHIETLVEQAYNYVKEKLPAVKSVEKKVSLAAGPVSDRWSRLNNNARKFLIAHTRAGVVGATRHVSETSLRNASKPTNGSTAAAAFGASGRHDAKRKAEEESRTVPRKKQKLTSSVDGTSGNARSSLPRILLSTKVENLSWDVALYGAIGSTSGLSVELQELAFLLEQGTGRQVPWRGVLSRMSGRLQKLLESKTNLKDLKVSHNKLRLILGNNKDDRNAFLACRAAFRKNVFDKAAKCRRAGEEQRRSPGRRDASPVGDRNKLAAAHRGAGSDLGRNSETTRESLDGSSRCGDMGSLEEVDDASFLPETNSIFNIKWDPTTNGSIVLANTLCVELQELAFLLEQGIEQDEPWRHIEKKRSNRLSSFIQDKTSLRAFKRCPNKLCLLLGEDLRSDLRVAFDAFRGAFRERAFQNVGGSCEAAAQENDASETHEEEMQPQCQTIAEEVDASEQTDQDEMQSVVDLCSISPPGSEENAEIDCETIQGEFGSETRISEQSEGAVQDDVSHSSPLCETPVELQCQTSQQEGGDSIRDDQEVIPSPIDLSSSSSYGQENDSDLTSQNAGHGSLLAENGVGTREVGSESASTVEVIELSDEEELHNVDEYISVVRSNHHYMLSPLVESRLLLHLSHWRDWHFSGKDGVTFATKQQSNLDAFSDTQLALAKLTKGQAQCHLQTESLKNAATIYFSIQSDLCLWWCNLVKEFCSDFANQEARSWDDFEYIQRSLWDNLLEMQHSMLQHHSLDCDPEQEDQLETESSDTIAPEEAKADANLPEGTSESEQAYIASLRHFHTVTTKTQSNSFREDTLSRWKEWLKLEPNVHGRQSPEKFLQSEEAMLETFLAKDKALFQEDVCALLVTTSSSEQPGRLFRRELDLFIKLRENMWRWFCFDIMLPSWKSATSDLHNDFAEFEQNQNSLWSYFHTISNAAYKIHVRQCKLKSAQAEAGVCTLPSPPTNTYVGALNAAFFGATIPSQQVAT